MVGKLREKGSLHHPDSVISSYSGCGNNWAMGYFGHRESHAVLERALDRVRREAEACDRFASVLLVHSAAGGTGSGTPSAHTAVWLVHHEALVRALPHGVCCTIGG